MAIDKLQGDLADYDGRHWQHPTGVETSRHNLLHVMKTAGKIAAHVEAIEDERLPESTPLDPMLVADLAIYAMRFANDGEYNLGDAIEGRMQQLRERHSGQGNEI